MKRIVFCLMLCSLLLCGCNDYKRLEFKSFDVDGFNGFSVTREDASIDMNARIGVANPTRSVFTLIAFDGTAYHADGTLFAKVVSTEQATVPAYSDGIVSVPVKLTIADPLSLFLGGKLDVEQMRADYQMKVKAGGMTRTITQYDVPLADLIRNVKAIGQKEEE